MIELISVAGLFPVNAPLMTYGVRDKAGLLVWNRDDAAIALREVVALGAVPPAEFALHCLRKGRATHFSAAGVPSEMLHEEKWKSGAYKTYVRANDTRYGLLSEVFPDRRRGGDRQPVRAPSGGVRSSTVRGRGS